MAIDFKTFIQIAPYICDVRKPVLLRGRHGIGKSEVVYQIASDIGVPVVERRASQMTEGDLLGLPSTEGKVTTWNPPDWLATACREPVLLFLDEVDRATPEVRQGIFELTDSRKIAGQTLHQDTLIFAAVNGGEHGAQYQVGEMDPAELDRYTVFDVEPTVEDWLDWAKSNVTGLVWDFVNQNRSHLEHTSDFEPNKVYPSRRSWKRLNDCLEAADMTNDPITASGGPLFHLTSAFVGFEAGVAFNDFCAKYNNQVTVEDLLDRGEIERTNDFGINDHLALIEKLEASEVFANVMESNQVQNLANYFVSLGSEEAMALWTVIGKGHHDNVVSLHSKQSTGGVLVSNRLVEILTDQTKEDKE